jgi:hypothetical protein
MTRLALLSTADGSILAAPLAAGGWVDLPNGARVSPAMADWQGDDDAPYRLLEITVFVMPDGKRTSGPATYALAGDTVTETFPVEDIPAVPDLTPAEKLANAGLTVDDLKSLLGLA